MMEVAVVTTGAVNYMFAPHSSQIVTTNKPTPNVLQAGCPSCRTTNSVKALKGKTGWLDISQKSDTLQVCIKIQEPTSAHDEDQWHRSVVKYGGHGQSGQAIKLFQITPYVNDFKNTENIYREN